MKPCPAWYEEIIDHALGQPMRSALKEHLGTCATCAAALDELHARAELIDSGLRGLAASEPSPSLAARVLSRLSPPVPIWKTVTAFASLVLIAGIAAWKSQEHQDIVSQEAVQISRWRSPTEALLRSTGDPLLKSVPKFGGSIP